jgi:hypothetical protein
MRASFVRTWVMVVLALFAAAAPTQALPRAASESLPLTAADEQRLLATLGEADFEALLSLLFRSFYAEAANKSDSPPQLFYAAPYFSPDPQAGAIGEQTIDIAGLALLEAFDILLAQLAVSPILLSRLEIVAREHEKASQRVKLALGAGARMGTQALDRLQTTNHWAIEAKALTAKLSRNLAQLPESNRKQLVLELGPISDRVAVKRPTNVLLTPEALLEFLTKIRAALAELSYGVRRATFISGFTKAEARLFSAYLDVRPDITVKALVVPKVFVSSVSQASTQVGVLDDRVLGVELIRSVNQASSGKCQSQNTCTVVLELTELGARTALLSVFGASLMPVIFSGDVVYADTLPLTTPRGPRAPTLNEQRVARDTGLNDVLLDRVQTAPSATSPHMLVLSTSAVLETSEIVAQLPEASIPAERPREPVVKGGKRTLVTRATRVFFDSFPLVCFEGQPTKPWQTKLRACSDPLLEIGTQVSRYEAVVNEYCVDKRLQSCLDRLVTLPFDQADGSLLELPLHSQQETGP